MQDELSTPVPWPEAEDVNMKNPFVVLKKYQGRMVSANAKKQWKKLCQNRSINDFVSEEISKLYCK
jgi:hypothetical protein